MIILSGVGILFSFNFFFTSLLSQKIFCDLKSFTKNGERNFIYSKTLLKGKPVEKNTIIDSTMGHFSIS